MRPRPQLRPPDPQPGAGLRAPPRWTSGRHRSARPHRRGAPAPAHGASREVRGRTVSALHRWRRATRWSVVSLSRRSSSLRGRGAAGRGWPGEPSTAREPDPRSGPGERGPRPAAHRALRSAGLPAARVPQPPARPARLGQRRPRGAGPARRRAWSGCRTVPRRRRDVGVPHDEGAIAQLRANSSANNGPRIVRLSWPPSTFPMKAVTAPVSPMWTKAPTSCHPTVLGSSPSGSRTATMPSGSRSK